ncbi:MAG: dihydropteroate synthase, partial [Candidatus Omnitrophica bacterium]|nr:dihydropteroate synthase [Candidatus Omnitrophota bacterium]
GDLAISKEALIGRKKETPCLLIGNLKSFSILKEKLMKQPFGLKRLASELDKLLTNYLKKEIIWDVGKIKFNLTRKVLIMGIINLTPDSFSGDGLYKHGLLYKSDPKQIISFAKKLINDGADIIDIGGESTRPGANPVPLEEEINRTIPVIKMFSQRNIKVPISIDTYKPQVAEEALKAGACIVNDISGLRNPKMIEVVSKYKAGVIIMHMKGNPRTMQINPRYKSVLDEIIKFFKKSTQEAQKKGISPNKIVIDPGIGFGKKLEHNLKILKHLDELKILGFPIMIGVSRKSFIGKILKIEEPQKRIFGTIGSALYAVNKGARILRVHDVKKVREALSVWQAIQEID